MIETLLFVAGGLIALLVGGEVLVRGAVGLAEKAGVSPLMIGLVIVGFGTSTPELVTSLEAAFAGSPDIAWANIVGSNIANTLLILGTAALVAPIAIARGVALRDVGIACAATLVFAGIAVAGLGAAWIGMLLIGLLAAYLAYCYREERSAAPEILHNAAHDRSEALELSDASLHPLQNGWTKPIALLLGGLALLIVGGQFLVTGAIDLARIAGASETLIGITVVAIGTSLPELVTSVVAARKGQPEVAFGNVVGSNIYNILGIGGATMIFAPGAIPANLWPFDIGVMAVSVIAVLAIVAMGLRISRPIGALLLSGYAAAMVVVVVQG